MMPTPINRLFRRLSQRRSKKSGNLDKQNIAAVQISTESAKRFSNGQSQSSSPPLLRTDSKIVHKGSWCCAPNCSSSLASSNNDSAGHQACSLLVPPSASSHPLSGSSTNSLAPPKKKRFSKQSSTTKSEAIQEPVLPVLPEKLLFQCLDSINNPFELCRMRRICKSVDEYVKCRLEKVTEMDVRKVKFSSNDDCLKNSSTIILEDKVWYAHPRGDYKVLMRLEPKADNSSRVEIIVDDSWTSKDVSLLRHVLVDVFRRNLRRITLDAPIVELVIASLSIIDLDRWYAFQCYMKAVNDHSLHLAIVQPSPTQQSGGVQDEDLYWPCVEELVIRTTEKDSAHLARILDYGVRSQIVMDRRRLDNLKIILTDVQKLNKELIRNLYHFRCWAGSAGFDDRFSQQYVVNVA
ncbi:F-box domain protein [Ditylenchus destructor]|nr:F-box domain protein [Ditylenchus destructor]